jgi:hypothetical protein
MVAVASPHPGTVDASTRTKGMEGQIQMIDAIPKIPTSPKDVIERVMQARRMQDPRTSMELHRIFKPVAHLSPQKIQKTRPA